MVHTFRKTISRFHEEHIYLYFLTESVLLTMLIELLSRKSLLDLFLFMGKQEMTFLCNVMIIFLTLSVSTLFGARRRFVHAVIKIVWVILGIVNAIVLRFRMTPFSAEDFSMLPSLFRIARNYLTAGSLALIVVGIAALLTGLVWMWRKLPKDKLHSHWITLAGRCGLIASCCYVFLSMGMQTQAISTDFMNLADAYEEYGFAYCFSTSIVDVGIDKPEGYDQELLDSITAGMKTQEEQSLLTVDRSCLEEDNYIGSGEAAVEPDVEQKTTSADLTQETAAETEGAQAPSVSDSNPNIIMIQLESFFDPYYLKDYTYSEDPIPNFRKLKEGSLNAASDFLTVPVVGAGTSNTEFEILTGMSCDYFGAGEYPYNTVLKDTAVEAIPQILRQYGYTSTAVHNNTGTFYNRNLVFANMGFDRFIPLEYMYDLELTPNNWHKDEALTQIMLDTLESSEGADFIYTITVQSHGRYPSTKVLEDPVITVSCENEMANTNALEYYVNMIYEVDQMIGDLIDRLDALNEPTVLVMFGDHLPALGFELEDLSQESLYQTEFVIWNNFGLQMTSGDMQAESLGTAVLQVFDLDDGIIPAFHEAYDGTEEYSTYLEILEYDMLYGEGYVLSTSDRTYTASDIKIGYKPISTAEVTVEDEDGKTYLYISGENFNEYSHIVINGKAKDTEYIDHSTLRTGEIPREIEEISVGQFDENLNQLGDSIAASFDPEVLLAE